MDDLEELPDDSTEHKKLNIYYQKNLSIKKSENQSRTLGVRILCINV